MAGIVPVRGREAKRLSEDPLARSSHVWLSEGPRTE